MGTIVNQAATPNGSSLPPRVGKGSSPTHHGASSRSLPKNPLKPSSLKLNCGTSGAVAAGAPSWLHHGARDLDAAVESGGNEGMFGVEDVIHGIERMSWENRWALTVTVSSAVKLEERQIEGITRKMRRLTGFRNLRLQNVVDPSLIAGFVICYDNDGSHVIDLSVRSQLAELEARIETTEQRRAELERGWGFADGR